MKITSLLLSALLMSAMATVFNACGTADHKSEVAQQSKTEPLPEDDSLTLTYMERGEKVASSAKMALGSALKSALAEGGVEQAIPFCNLKALPIADSISQAYNCTISRTALRYRNPNNKPDEEETKVLSYFTAKLEKGEMPSAQLWQHEDVMNYYTPIVTQQFCLQCHGNTESDISAADYALIKQYYPEDMATGFETGKLRGMMRIVFAKDM